MNDERRAMNGKPSNLRDRTRDFAIRIIRLYNKLPRDGAASVIGKQLVRSGTSVGAHYREAYRARSTAEFVSKLNGGLQELEETSYWLELLVHSETVAPKRLEPLQTEANELAAIFVASIKTARRSSRE